ncbi:MAG: RNase adapter RapZ [Acidimicrobiales bacterium]|nr:RNase adapter RapZ [Acidimicrobiales bacterium]
MATVSEGTPTSEFIVITGLSGAGRSLAADHLEDLGWFVIDNLPPQLIPKVAELASAPRSEFSQVVLVVGTGPGFEDVLPALRQVRAGDTPVRILFLEASTSVLVQRYESTRRRHPLSDEQTIVDAIDRERVLLDPVKAEADVVVDTSDLNVHQLRERMITLFGDESDPASQLRTSVISFGYKHGLPLDVDIVFDCRFLPNPHWVPELQAHTGLDPAVRDFVLGQDEAASFLDGFDSVLEVVVPAFLREGKSYLTVALGCTGGRHRSVVLAEELAERMSAHGLNASVTHRDIDR